MTAFEHYSSVNVPSKWGAGGHALARQDASRIVALNRIEEFAVRADTVVAVSLFSAPRRY
jgi:hypothetical protein